MSTQTFWGYRRENGRVGIRNHVIALPLDDLSNAACEAVAHNIKGVLALPHHYGRLQFGEDLELHFRTLIGTGSNPNVAAVVVIGIEPGWTNRVVEGIAKTGKPVIGFAIERNGDIKTIADAARAAQGFLQTASEHRREECEFSDLWISTKCGESDTTSGLGANPTVGNLIDKLDPLGVTTCFGETSEITGAEQVCMQRAASTEVGEKFIKTWTAYNDVIEQFKTDDLSESQPTKGNIEGGLTTIEEKAFGNLEKIGHKTRYIDVLGTGRGARAGRGALLHGYLLRRGGVRHLAGRRRLRRAPLSDRAGQRHRQPHRARHQAHGQPAHRARDVRARRSRRIRHPAPGDELRRGRRRALRHHAEDLRRPAHLRRGARSPRVRDDQALPQRMRQIR